MKAIAARLMMAIAVRSLGETRSEWARAMQAEYAVACDLGEGPGFAIGCLVGALRELPTHEEGRFALASHVLAVGIIVPMAALLVANVMVVWPVFGSGLIACDGWQTVPVNAANLAALPALIVLTAALGVGHLRMAWFVLDRDWPRVAALGRLGAATIVTMVAFASIVFVGDPCALLLAATVVIELAGITVLGRWHGELISHAAAASR